jgi:hypothetical protein
MFSAKRKGEKSVFDEELQYLFQTILAGMAIVAWCAIAIMFRDLKMYSESFGTVVLIVAIAVHIAEDTNGDR